METMDEVEVLRLVQDGKLGHLGLAAGGRAYVVPLFYGWDGAAFYFQTPPGLKDEFLHGTEEACFAVTEAATQDDWASVLAFGPVEEVQDVPEQLRAMDALIQVPLPPRPGRTPRGEPRRSAEGMRMFRLRPRHMTGRRSSAPPPSREERELGLRGM